MKRKENNSTLYDILEVPKTVTVKQLKDAYINKIFKYHPNINSVAITTDAHQMIYQINLAYSTLRNMEAREEYDKMLHITTNYEICSQEDYDESSNLRFIDLIQALYNNYQDFKSSYDFEMTKEEITLFENILLLFEQIITEEKPKSKTKTKSKPN